MPGHPGLEGFSYFVWHRKEAAEGLLKESKENA
jgi:hypothetical protein